MMRVKVAKDYDLVEPALTVSFPAGEHEVTKEIGEKLIKAEVATEVKSRETPAVKEREEGGD